MVRGGSLFYCTWCHKPIRGKASKREGFCYRCRKRLEREGGGA